ncbi:MAG: hypothetical protein UHX00_14235 [Caryophanon sp.]|nr:hypothetical protein [Caryophanon sp.]
MTQDPVKRDVGAVRRLEEGGERHVHVAPPAEQTSCSPPSPRNASRNTLLLIHWPINKLDNGFDFTIESEA